MTITRGGAAKAPRPGAPEAPGESEAGEASTDPPAATTTISRTRRTHVPGAGSEHAAAVEKAQREMLREGASTVSVPVDATAAERAPRPRIGADVVCEALLRQGVDVFFSYPGGVILPLYDVLGDYPELRHILVRHEQGGAHAADGYARATGRVGVCMGTSGPGATNLVTGIATAQLDSVPMVAITGNVPGRADRQGRVPGDRHQRHHAADDQAQLPRPRRRRHSRASSPRRSTSPEPDGPVPSTSTSPRTRSSRRRAPSTPPTPRSSPACRASVRTWTATTEQLKTAAAEIAAGEAAGDPRRARRAPSPRPGTSSGAFAEKTQHPGRLDAARDRSDGRGAPAGLRLHGDARLEARQPGDPVRRPADRHRDALRRPGDRQRPDLRARTPGSSTSTSTRPRSARTSPSRSPSSATPSACSRPCPDGRARSTRTTRRDYFDAAGGLATRFRGLVAGTGPARGETACCRPTTSSSGSAS